MTIDGDLIVFTPEHFALSVSSFPSSVSVTQSQQVL